MSSQPHFSSDRPKLTPAQAHDAMGARAPRFKPPSMRRFSISYNERKGRVRERYHMARMPRPIHSFLVTHRRRFTTGHKHKQPYQG